MRLLSSIYVNSFSSHARRKALDHQYPMPSSSIALGSGISGNIPQKSIANPFNMISIPYRHGMSVGELARLLNEEYHHNAELKIVPMDNWRGEEWDNTNLSWKFISPNITSYNKLKYFSISDLLASDNIIENGKGSDREHQILVHPQIDSASDLVLKLKELKLPGVEFFPAVFVPNDGPFKGEICNGFSIKVTDSEVYRPWAIAIESAKVIKSMYPDTVSYTHLTLPTSDLV